jgi:hypothetical protein
MRSSTVIALIALCLAVAHPSDASATTGWGSYSVDIEDRYRIQGFNGSGFVAALDAGGNPTDPPLIDITKHPGYSGPPDFAVTSTHILVRYESHLPRSVEDDPQRAYFAIRKRDSLVTGPLSDEAFSDSSFGLAAGLRWKTPRTAADSFGRFVIVCAIIVPWIPLLPIVFLVYLWIRRRQRKYAATRTESGIDAGTPSA